MTNFRIMAGIVRNFTRDYIAAEMDTAKCDKMKLASCQIFYYFTDKSEELSNLFVVLY